MKNTTITLGIDIKNESITLSEAALHQQLTALGVYDPVVSLLESLDMLGKTKGKTGVDREIAEQAYKHNISRVRKMCGIVPPPPNVPQVSKKAEPKRFTNQAYSDEEKATLFD